MPTDLTIDFVSDISCPWCAIGLYSLERALGELNGRVVASIHVRPFELNPHMPPGGQDLAEHMTHKYGSTPEQQAQFQETLRQRGAAVGLTFRWDARKRIYSTFDAHRLLHWAGLVGNHPSGGQFALEHVLLKAYFTCGESPESHDVLLRAVGEVGLPVEQAHAILESSAYADDVRVMETLYIDAGINSVPAAILNNTYLISGAQSVDAFRQAMENVMDGKIDL